MKRLNDTKGPIALNAKLGEVDLTDGNMVIQRIEITNESDADDRIGYGVLVENFEIYEEDAGGNYALAPVGVLSAEGSFAIVSDKEFNAISFGVEVAAATDITSIEFLGTGNAGDVKASRLIAGAANATGEALQLLAIATPKKLDVDTDGLPAGKFVCVITVAQIELNSLKLAKINSQAPVATLSTLIDEPFVKTGPDENKIAVVSGGDVTISIQHSR